MRKLFFIALAAIAFTFTSCSNDTIEAPSPKDLTVTVNYDTTVSHDSTITAARYGCDGKLLKMPKVKAHTPAYQHINGSKSVTLSNEELNKMGFFHYITDGKLPSRIIEGSPTLMSFPDWLKTLFTWIFWIILIALALGVLWALWKLFEYLIDEAAHRKRLRERRASYIPPVTANIVNKDSSQVPPAANPADSNTDRAADDNGKNVVTFPNGQGINIFIGNNNKIQNIIISDKEVKITEKGDAPIVEAK